MATKKLTAQVLAAPRQMPSVPGWFVGPRAWTLVGMAAVGTGLALNWDWLAAIGAAPILIAILPCAAMCALGICMRGGASKSCSIRPAADANRPTPDDLRP